MNLLSAVWKPSTTVYNLGITKPSFYSLKYSKETYCLKVKRKIKTKKFAVGFPN